MSPRCWYRVRIERGRVGFPVGTWCEVLYRPMATAIADKLENLGVTAAVEEVTQR